MRSAALTVVLAVLVLSGCGGSASSQPSLSSFKSGFEAEKASFRQLGLDLQTAITGAKAKTDAQLAKEINGLATRSSQQAARLATLKPPAKFSAALIQLAGGFRSVSADLSSIAAAAAKHDAVTARAATETLLTDAAKVKSADAAITRGLGLSAAG